MRLPETDYEMWRMGHWGIIIMLVGTIISCIYDALKDSCQLQRYFVYLDILIIKNKGYVQFKLQLF